jgi:hypothetical protein
MAMLFKSKAVDMAVRRGMPKDINTGIKMKAAPIPAMVNIVVKIKVISDAIK